MRLVFNAYMASDDVAARVDSAFAESARCHDCEAAGARVFCGAHRQAVAELLREVTGGEPRIEMQLQAMQRSLEQTKGRNNQYAYNREG